MIPFAPEPGTPPISPEWIGGGILSVITGLGAWLESRRRYRKEDQSAAVTEREEIVKIINTDLVEPLRKELGEVRTRLDTAEGEIDSLKKAKSALEKFIYHLLGILNRHELAHEIKLDAPDGIEL